MDAAMRQTRRAVTIYAETLVMCPHGAPDRESAEALLQEVSAFLANRPGLRATHVKVQCGSQEADYVLSVNGKSVTFTAPSTLGM